MKNYYVIQHPLEAQTRIKLFITDYEITCLAMFLSNAAVFSVAIFGWMHQWSSLVNFICFFITCFDYVFDSVNANFGEVKSEYESNQQGNKTNFVKQLAFKGK